MKYLRRRRSRSRAGRKRSRLSSSTGAGPRPRTPTTPGTRSRPPSATAEMSSGVATSPSPRSTQSIGALAMLDQFVGDEGGAVAADEDEAAAQRLLRRLRQVEDLGHVGQIVEREAQSLGPEIGEHPGEFLVAEGLQVEQAHLVAGPAHRLGDPLHAERLQTQIDFAVHERSGMDQKDTHRGLPLAS